MKKAKIMLAAVCIFAAVGGAVAFKARQTNGFIFKAGRTYAVTVDQDCTVIGAGCSYTSSDGGTYQLYTLSGSIYNSVKE